MPTIRSGELRGLIADQEAEVMAPLFVVLIYSVYKLIKFKLTIWEPITFLLLSIASILSCFIYGISIHSKIKGPIISLIFLIALIPWAFGTFLFLYKGLWPLTFLLTEFTWWTIIKSIIWIALSYRIVNQYYLLTEFAVKVSEGKIEITEE